MQPVTVCHVTTVHGEDDVRIFHKEAVSLAQAGYRVSLVVPTEKARTSRDIMIVALPRPRRRLLRMTSTVITALRAAAALRADVYHLHDPELILAGLWLHARGHRVVYDVHEDLPRQIHGKDWVPRPLRNGLSRLACLLERTTAAAADGVVAATPAIASHFPENKTVTVQNYPLAAELSPGRREHRPFSQRPHNVIYVGGITAIRGARELVHAMGLLPATSPAKLLLVGRFSPPSLESDLKQLPGWDRVTPCGWRSRTDVAGLLSQARLGIVNFLPLPNHTDAQPTKLFEYLSAGLPVLASDFPLWRDLVDTEKCGWVAAPQDPAALSHVIQWADEHPDEAERYGDNGRQAVLARYNWDSEAQKLLGLYQDLMARPAGTRTRRAAPGRRQPRPEAGTGK